MKSIYFVKKSIVNDVKVHLEEQKDLIIKEISISDDSQYSVLSFSFNLNEGKEVADKLSKLTETLEKEFPNNKIKMSYSDASTYYTRTLYPLFNAIEHKIRHFITAAVLKLEAKNDVEKIPEGLEKLDLGEIYTQFFIDNSFVDNVKAGVNNNKNKLAEDAVVPQDFFTLGGSFTKRELLKFLEAVPESAKWNSFGNGNAVPTLMKNYKDFKTIRNSVMHAHNIDKKIFDKGLRLCNKINEELDKEIDMLLTTEYKVSSFEYGGLSFPSGVYTLKEVKVPVGVTEPLETKFTIFPNGDVEEFEDFEFQIVKDDTDPSDILSFENIVNGNNSICNDNDIKITDKNQALLVSLNPELSDKEWDIQSLGDWIISKDKKSGIKYIFGVHYSNKRLVSIVEVSNPKVVENNRIRFEKEKTIYLYPKKKGQYAPYLFEEAKDWNNQNPIKYL